MQHTQNLAVHHKQHGSFLLERLLGSTVVHNQVEQAHCTEWSGLAITDAFPTFPTLTSHYLYQFGVCHRITQSTNVLSLSEVVLLSPSSLAVPLQSKVYKGTPLHWWWEVSALYTARMSYPTLVYLEHSYKETVILNYYS